MPVSNVKTTRSAAAAVGYNMKGRGKQWREHTQLGTTRAVWRSNSFGDEEVFVRYCEMSKARRDGVEALTYIISWKDDELPPDDPASWDAAGYFAQAFCETHAPGHPYDISVHVDGEGRKVHAHVVIANCSLADETLLTTKKEITLHRIVARKVDELARERGMHVIEPQRSGGWQDMRVKHVEAVERGGAAKAKAQARLVIGDVLAGIYDEGGFASIDEWIERCADAGVEAELKPDKQHGDTPGLVYRMRVQTDDGKTRKRRSKASAIASDFTVAGIEARIEQLQQARAQAYEEAEARRRELEEQRKHELERREKQVQREMEQAKERHAVPDVAQEFERRWDDERFMRFGVDEVLNAAEMVRERVDAARADGADASVCNAMLNEIDDVEHGEMPRAKRNARHVDVSRAIADEVSRDAHVELASVSQHYRHAIRDKTAAQEALEKLRDREAKAADAEAKYDNAKGFVQHAVRYTVLFARWFQVGMARYDLLQAIGADGEAPSGDEFGSLNDMVADGIASMEHQRRFEQAVHAGEIKHGEDAQRGEESLQ